MDYAIAVCAATIHLHASHKILPLKHFEKPLTLFRGPLKGTVRPEKVPKTGRETVRGQGYGLAGE
jgi:hypothetical protein